MSIVLSLITCNSATKLSHTPITLRHVLKSTLQVPYRAVILVDNSADSTVSEIEKFCEDYGKELIVIRGGRTRGEARQLAIDCFLERFSEEWLMFLDDDVVLRSGWFREASIYMRCPRVGIIWGIAFDACSDTALYLEKLGVPYVSYLIREFFHRGGTHDTLLRREAIADIKIPPDLHYYEDGYIVRHVLSRGYEARIVYRGCIHLNPYGDWRVREIKRMAYLAKKYGFETGSLGRVARSFLSIVPHLLSGVRVFGTRGFRRAVNRWRMKVLFRLSLLLV